MKVFIAETRKAWAAAAIALSGAWSTAATDDVITGIEVATIVIAAVVAGVVTWAVPNRAPATPPAVDV